MLFITVNLKYKINNKILRNFDCYIFYNKLLILKAKYNVVYIQYQSLIFATVWQ